MQSHYHDVKVIQTGQGAQSPVWLSPTGNPVAPLGSTDSLRELLDLVHRFINSITNLFRLRLSDST